MQAGYLLGNVLAEHPGMKPIVVAEVQRFMFRPGLQERARYYAVVFLNQLQLSHHPTHGAYQSPPAACCSVREVLAAGLLAVSSFSVG